MSAKEMFKKLGYKKLPKKVNKNYIIYENEQELYGSLTPRKTKIIVLFCINDKSVQFSPYHQYSLKELQAINKQVEELGWDKQ